MGLWRKKLVLQSNRVGVCNGERQNPITEEKLKAPRFPARFFRLMRWRSLNEFTWESSFDGTIDLSCFRDPGFRERRRQMSECFEEERIETHELIWDSKKMMMVLLWRRRRLQGIPVDDFWKREKEKQQSFQSCWNERREACKFLRNIKQRERIGRLVSTEKTAEGGNGISCLLYPNPPSPDALTITPRVTPSGPQGPWAACNTFI